MPRQARIDAPGALHHIIVRGIERRKIFRDNKDKDNFVQCLGDIIKDTSTPCYAWSLLSNHVHLLLVNIKDLLNREAYFVTGPHVSWMKQHHRWQ